jgi:hypothetical protein
MDKVSEAILTLKPVTFHYKSDKTRTPQFGLIAEEVAKANPDLVVRDADGEIYTVRYDQVNAMLLNEFLKENPTRCCLYRWCYPAVPKNQWRCLTGIASNRWGGDSLSDGRKCRVSQGEGCKE